jgi:hypothetical protein
LPRSAATQPDGQNLRNAVENKQQQVKHTAQQHARDAQPLRIAQDSHVLLLETATHMASDTVTLEYAHICMQCCR